MELKDRRPNRSATAREQQMLPRKFFRWDASTRLKLSGEARMSQTRTKPPGAIYHAQTQRLWMRPCLLFRAILIQSFISQVQMRSIVTTQPFLTNSILSDRFFTTLPIKGTWRLIQP